MASLCKTTPNSNQLLPIFFKVFTREKKIVIKRSFLIPVKADRANEIFSPLLRMQACNGVVYSILDGLTKLQIFHVIQSFYAHGDLLEFYDSLTSYSDRHITSAEKTTARSLKTLQLAFLARDENLFSKFLYNFLMFTSP